MEEKTAKMGLWPKNWEWFSIGEETANLGSWPKIYYVQGVWEEGITWWRRWVIDGVAPLAAPDARVLRQVQATCTPKKANTLSSVLSY